MAALDAADQTRIDNLIIAHDAAKAAMLTIIADAGAGVDQSAATIDVLVLTDSVSTFSNKVKVLDATDSTSLVTGAAQIAGGLAVAQSSFFGQTLTINRLVNAASTQFGLSVFQSTLANRGFKILSNSGSGTFNIGGPLDMVIANTGPNGDIYFATDLEATPDQMLRLVGATLNAEFAGGIAFSGDSSGVAANVQDDYEEGIWSPSFDGQTTGLTSVTTSVVVAKYTKLGRLVTVTFDLRITAVNLGAAAGALLITNLPFAVGQQTASNGGVGSASGWISGRLPSGTAADIGTTSFRLFAPSGTATVQIPVTDLSGDESIQGGFSYYV